MRPDQSDQPLYFCSVGLRRPSAGRVRPAARAIGKYRGDSRRIIKASGSCARPKMKTKLKARCLGTAHGRQNVLLSNRLRVIKSLYSWESPIVMQKGRTPGNPFPRCARRKAKSAIGDAFGVCKMPALARSGNLRQYGFKVRRISAAALSDLLPGLLDRRWSSARPVFP